MKEATHKKAYILYDSVYMKFKSRQNKSIVLEASIVVTPGEWVAVNGKGHNTMFHKSSDSQLSVGHLAVLTLQRFIKLYTNDFCTCLAVHYTSIRILFLIELWGKLEQWRQVTQSGRVAQGRDQEWTSGLASPVKPVLSPLALKPPLGSWG